MDTPKRPPPGGDFDKGPAFLAVSLTTIIIALTFVCVRIYVRTRIVRAFGWDDWMVALAGVSYSSIRRVWIRSSDST